MNLSKIKLVVTDMDGTLLNSNHEVSERFFELFAKLRKRGILFAAASGRQHNSIVDKLYAVKNDIIVIAENGGYTTQNGTELVFTPLPNQSKNLILDSLVDVKQAHPVLCAKNNAYLSNASQVFVDKLKEYYTEFEILDDLRAFTGELLKVAVFHFESSEKYIYPAVKHLEGDLKVKVSGENWVDISSQNANKGYALEFVQKKFGIGKAETLVFGDYNNDLEMMAMADFSFAMENAHPNVKKAANYATTSNDDFGVERVLEKLVNQS